MLFAISVFTAVANVLLGTFTYFKNRKSATHKLVFILCIILGGWAIANYFSVVASHPDQILFWIRVVMFICSFMSFSLLALVETFPHKQLNLKHNSVLLFGILSLITASIAFTPLIFREVTINNGNPVPIPGYGIPLFGINLVGGVIISFITLRKKYLSAKGLEKNQLRFFYFGVTLTFSLLIFTNFLFVVFLNFTKLVILGPFWTLILVTCITYAIIKHRFFDINLIVARTVSYSLLLLLLGGFYASSLFLIGNFLLPTKFTNNEFWVSTALALIMAYSFQPWRRFLENLTDKYFYKGGYDSHEVLTVMSKVMASTYILDDLLNRILQNLVSSVRIRRGQILLLEKENPYYWQSAGYQGNEVLLEADEIKKIIKNLHEGSIYFEEIDESEIKNIMRKKELNVIIPLNIKDEKIGLILLGDKSSGDMYSEQDLKLLEILAPELAIAIQNAKAIQEINHFNETLKEEIKKATVDLRNANSRLKLLDQIKDEFVSIASHELRTPMTAIKSYLWMVLKKPQAGDKLSRKTTQHIQRAYQSTERLINLVNDMLDVSRIEAGRVELRPVTTDLRSLVDDVIQEVAAKAEQTHLHIILDMPKDLPSLKIDPDKIHQVLINLIGNAIKFTPPKGNITISANLTNQEILLSVTDTGKGISPADQEKLFKKFGRLDHSLVSVAEAGGTGLGLYISKQLVEFHGGHIWVESQIDKGSSFKFTLPLKPISPAKTINQTDTRKISANQPNAINYPHH